MLKRVKIVLLLIAMTILVGCGDAGNAVDTIGGKVVDGYISKATVFIDMNNDGNYTIGEPKTITDDNGAYSFENKPEYQGKTIIVSGGIDQDTKKQYQGKLKSIITNKSVANITPFTTQIATLVKEHNKTLSQAEAKIRQIFNIDQDINLNEDPIEYFRQNSTNSKAKDFLALNVALHKAIDTLALAKQKDNNTTSLVDISEDIFSALSYGIEDTNSTSTIQKIISQATKNTKAKEKLGAKATNSALAAAKVAFESMKAFNDINISKINFDLDKEVAKASIKADNVKEEFEKVFDQDDFDFNITINEIKSDYNFKAQKDIDLDTEWIQNITGVTGFEAQILKDQLNGDTISKENIDNKIQNNISSKVKVDTNQTAIPLYAPNEVIVMFEDNNLTKKEQNMDDAFEQMDKDMASAFKQMDDELKTAMTNMEAEMNATFSSVFNNVFGSDSNFTNQNFVNLGICFVKSTTKTTQEMIEALKNNPKVKFVAPNYTVTISDEYSDKLWAIKNVGQVVNDKSGIADADMDVKEAWNITKGSSDVVVAVLDTGVDYLHEDIKDNMVSDGAHHGYDFAGDDDGNNDDDPMPDTPYREKGHYHGTHVAGTIAATSGNGRGIEGIAPNVKILALKVFRPKGYGYTSDILEAYDYVAKKKKEGMNIVTVNASYGTTNGNQKDSQNKAIKKLGDLGIVFCVAAGNDGSNNDAKPYYPSSYDASNIIAVAASDQDDELANFSNYGKNSVDIAAPGTNILSIIPPENSDETHNDYAYLNGTSMATPNVAGTIALLASKYPDKSAKELKDLLLDGADLKSQFNGKLVVAGRVNAFNSLKSKNTAPTANNDSAKVKARNSVNIDVLANDTDKEGDTLTIKSVATPSKGSASIENEKVKYTANNGTSGTDTFSYTISDGEKTASANITVTIQAQANHTPIANNDTNTTKQDNSIVLDVLANDTDSDGDNLTIKNVTNPTNGITKIVDNKIKYTPKKGYYGNDSFIYTITDGTDEANATVSMTIEQKTSANNPPKAKNDTASTNENTLVSIDVLANDTDADGDTLSIKSIEKPKYGTTSINGGKIDYTPNSGYSGTDIFYYTVSDTKDTDRAKVTVNVISSSNHPPVANNDNVSTDKGWSVNFDPLKNDTDQDSGDRISLKSYTQPSCGKVSKSWFGGLEYDPKDNCSGAYSFTYTIEDKYGATDNATVNITVNSGGNDDSDWGNWNWDNNF